MTEKGAYVIDVPYDNAPKILVMMTLPPPDILLGVAPQSGNVVEGGGWWVKTNLPHWDKKRDLKEARTRAALHPLYFARILAKIAHSFAVAELGAEAFHPLLPNLILGRPEWLFTYVVGGMLGPVAATENLHELSLEQYKVVEDNYWMAKIQLFDDEGAPVYNVVVGQANLTSP